LFQAPGGFSERAAVFSVSVVDHCLNDQPVPLRDERQHGVGALA